MPVANSLRQAEYEAELETLFKNAKIVDHQRDPCDADFMPQRQNGLTSSTRQRRRAFKNSKQWAAGWNASAPEEYHQPESLNSTYVFYIKHDNHRDSATWLHVAKCFKIWDLDERGSHRSLWRLFHRGHHLLVVGVPQSSYSKYKPQSLVPFQVDSVAENEV